MRVGILAIQGAFAEHEYCLKQAFAEDNNLGCSTVNNEPLLEISNVRKPSDLEGLDGLIIPGGESTTMSKHLGKQGFKEEICKWMKGTNGYQPFTWGTCAGLILLANEVEEARDGGQTILGGIDITTNRNSFGRQRESFETKVDLHKEELRSSSDFYHGVFIRAPGVSSVNSHLVDVLATIDVEDETRPVAVQQGSLMATSFHPELTEDFRWHAYFLNQVRKQLCLKKDSHTESDVAL